MAGRLKRKGGAAPRRIEAVTGLRRSPRSSRHSSTAASERRRTGRRRRGLSARTMRRAPHRTTASPTAASGTGPGRSRRRSGAARTSRWAAAPPCRNPSTATPGTATGRPDGPRTRRCGAARRRTWAASTESLSQALGAKPGPASQGSTCGRWPSRRRGAFQAVASGTRTTRSSRSSFLWQPPLGGDDGRCILPACVQAFPSCSFDAPHLCG
mmetsp:Transcript_27769/g.74044  ORF Transcript_27769/g.74044 Transcript_27769/m.74044 type:complete len:212 (-) Transcript_27769:356-991(-)